MNEILRMLLICLISFFCSAVGLEIIVIIFIVANDLFSRKKHSENGEKYKSKGVMEVEKITNAKIISTTLGYYNHGILTFELCIEIAGGGGCIFGQYVLDSYDESKGERIPTAVGFECITKIMQTVGVEKWEDLKGRYIRVADYEWGEQIKIIGNLMEDKWFDIEKFFGERVSRS